MRYAGLNGLEGTDFHDVNNQGNHPYRSDTMSADAANDIPRTAFAGTNDYALGYFAVAEWVNHTRNYPAGTYNVYGRFAAGGGTSYMSLSQVTNSTAASLGTFTVENTGGWNTYDYVPLRDSFGNFLELTIPAASPLTMRLTHTGGADANMNFLMLAAPRNDLPRISNVYPDGTLELQATNTFRFTASNPTVPIYSTNISLTLNGVDVTSQLTISGSVNSWNVSMPLALNGPRYAAVITVRDANTNVATTTIYFDTFNPTNFTWEAEDYDFGSGLFIDNPVPTSGPAANSYFGQVGTYGVDYYLESSSGTTYLYRPSDAMPTDVCGDYPPLAKHVTARLTDPTVKDYNLAYWTSNSWANYTRTYPAGTYNVYARMASGSGGQRPAGQDLGRSHESPGAVQPLQLGLGHLQLVAAGGCKRPAGHSQSRRGEHPACDHRRERQCQPVHAGDAARGDNASGDHRNSGRQQHRAFVPDAKRACISGVGQGQPHRRQLVADRDLIGRWRNEVMERAGHAGASLLPFGGRIDTRNTAPFASLRDFRPACRPTAGASLPLTAESYLCA